MGFDLDDEELEETEKLLKGGKKMKDYEMIMILPPKIKEKEYNYIVEDLKSKIEIFSQKFEVENMGERKLAYAIGRYSSGRYILIILRETNKLK